jgi:hypothetical protein
VTTPLLDPPVDAHEATAAHDPDDVLLPPTAGARFAAVVAVLALLVGGLALPSGPPSDATRFGSLVAGPLEVGDGQAWRTLPEGETIEDGWSLRAVGGAVTLAVDEGRIVLATGTRAAVADGRLVVDRGSVLIDGAPDRSLVVGGVSTAGTGTWRVDAGAQPRLATYDGEVTTDDGGSEVVLPAYGQLTIRDRTVGGAVPVPLRYLASDPFDREQLDEAFRVDDLAAALARSLASTYGDDPRDLDFYGAFLAVGPDVVPFLDDLALVTSGSRFGPPREVLLGVTVTDAVAGLTGASIAETAATVSSMRERGAEWGLLLVAAGGGTEAFNEAADRLLEEAASDPPPPLEEPATEAGTGVDTDTGPAPAPAPAPTTPAPTGGAGGGTGGGTSGGPPASDGGSSPPPSEPAPPSSGPLAPVEDAVRDLGSALGGTVEGVTDSLADVVGGVDELLAPTTGGLLGGG